MKQCALQYPEIEFTAYAGSMEQGLALAKRYSEHYDVIISRANTAKMISQSVHIPVIDIGIGYYDVLRCIKMAQNTGTKFALLGFQSLTVIAKNLCDLLQIHVDIFSFSVDNWKGSGDLLDRMKEQGYKTVVCDMIPYDHAKMIGLTPILLTSSAESVKQAMENAIGTWQQYQKLCNSNAMMQSLIRSSSNQYLILDLEAAAIIPQSMMKKRKNLSRACKKSLENAALPPGVLSLSHWETSCIPSAPAWLRKGISLISSSASCYPRSL
mgnify:CR=1 FL=1